eukprot:SAG11_NODE_27_length_23309_cov_10.579362_23_plen_96_part_00
MKSIKAFSDELEEPRELLDSVVDDLNEAPLGAVNDSSVGNQAINPAGLYPVKLGSVCPNGPDPEMSGSGKMDLSKYGPTNQKSGSCRETTGSVRR